MLTLYSGRGVVNVNGTSALLGGGLVFVWEWLFAALLCSGVWLCPPPIHVLRIELPLSSRPMRSLCGPPLRRDPPHIQCDQYRGRRPYTHFFHRLKGKGLSDEHGRLCVSVCVCVCVFVWCTRTHIRVCVCARVCLYTRAHVLSCVCVCVCVRPLHYKSCK